MEPSPKPSKGGAGRGQGRKALPDDEKAVQMLLTIKPALLKEVDRWVGGQKKGRSKFICSAIQAHIDHLQGLMDQTDEFLEKHDIPD